MQNISRNTRIDVADTRGRAWGRTFIQGNQYDCKCKCTQPQFDPSGCDSTFLSDCGVCLRSTVVVGPNYDVNGCLRRAAENRIRCLQSLCAKNGADCAIVRR